MPGPLQSCILGKVCLAFNVGICMGGPMLSEVCQALFVVCGFESTGIGLGESACTSLPLLPAIVQKALALSLSLSPASQSLSQSVSHSICQSVCQSVRLAVSQSVSLSVCHLVW